MYMANNTDPASIAKILVWPAVVLIIVLSVLILFRDKIAPSNLEASDKGIKISFYLLQAAEHGGPGSAAGNPAPVNLEAIQASAKAGSSISLQGAKILWVDDNPDGQIYERHALEQLGIEFTLANNTNDAVRLLQQQRFRLVITDFARKDDPQGGYTLLEALRKIQPSTPLVIYSGSANPDLIAEAKRRGAYTETNQPQELFDAAVDAIKSKPAQAGS
jgi:CheY-like chemotaxis protein